MALTSGDSEGSGTPAGLFATTHWSVVLEAGKQGRPQAAAALEKLCRSYWYPLYAFIRHRGYSPEDAQDLTQGFLAGLLATGSLDTVHPTKGRFRSFLLAALNHFLANEWDKARTLKRGGNRTMVSLDAAESRYDAEPRDPLSPDRLFERRWALTLLEQVSARLSAEYRSTNRGPLFESLQVYLAGEKGLPPYQHTADRLGLSLDAVKKAVERLRRRYGELMREEIARTVSEPAEVDQEIRYLRTVLTGQ